jgi:UDP-N-acetylglucosamine enolpyruvyl transferase
MKFNTPSITGLMQMVLAVAAAAGATHVITFDPQVTDFITALVAALAGVHGIASGQQK